MTSEIVEARGLLRSFQSLLVVLSLATVCASQSNELDKLIDPILATHRFSEVAISPDGAHVAWVDKSVRSDREYGYRVVVADTAAGSQPHTLEGPDSANQSAIAWSPDGKELAFIAETDTPGQEELRVSSANGTAVRRMATFHGELNSTRWSPDGRTISVLYSKAEPDTAPKPAVVVMGKEYSRQRIALVDVNSTKTRFLTPEDLFVYEYDWSPDSRRLIATASPCCTLAKGSGDDNWWTAELFRVDAESGRETSIFKPQLQIASPKWSPDGTHIAWIGGLMSDFIAPGGDLFLSDLDGKNIRDITPGLKASISWFAWTGRDTVTTTEIKDGEAVITTIHTDTATAETVWQSPDGPFTGGLVFALSLASDGLASAAVRESFDRAPEVWAGPIGKWHQVTFINKTNEVSWGKADSIHWNSDGMQIQGWLLYPAHYTPSKKYPMVVLVHGGPAAAALAHWPPAFDDVEVLSSLGYFVLYPNPRGSMGQGEAFTEGNVKDLGYGDLRDIEAGVKSVTEDFPVDAQRIGITGWSYGGFMAMWAITQTDMFRASVAGPGVSNWQSYYGQVDLEKWLIPYFGASAYDDPKLYARSSPINFVRNVRAATLFYVGNQDFVCPAPQSFELWRALRHLGVDTELLFYPGEGHGLTRPADQRDITEQMVRWFSERLR